MNKYIMKITKAGYMKYISHLDMVRLFRNAFKKAGIKISYSQGFNPHPKISFALPLSLGYSSTCEILEFETNEKNDPGEMLNIMNTIMPEGIKITECAESEEAKSFAAKVAAASYEISIPADAGSGADVAGLCERFLSQKSIPALKKQKATGAVKEIDIKNMIQTMSGAGTGDKITLYVKMDSGGASNLSPELLISSFLSFSGLNAQRDMIDVKRVGLYLKS